MNDLEALHKDFDAFLVRHHVAEGLHWFATEHPVLSLAMTVSFLTVAIAMMTDMDRDRNAPASPSTPLPPRRLWFTWRKPEPLPAPQPIEPADIVYGAQRQLIQRQRAWMHDVARAQVTAQLDGDTLKATGHAFADWFEKKITIPANATANDVIPFNAWVADYHAYCDAHASTRLNDGDLHEHMVSYSRSYDCTLDQQGNFHGGYLK
jgi:hypothetical protein